MLPSYQTYLWSTVRIFDQILPLEYEAIGKDLHSGFTVTKLLYIH